jgi:hypothetical protein
VATASLLSSILASATSSGSWACTPQRPSYHARASHHLLHQHLQGLERVVALRYDPQKLLVLRL